MTTQTMSIMKTKNNQTIKNTQKVFTKRVNTNQKVNTDHIYEINI